MTKKEKIQSVTAMIDSIADYFGAAGKNGSRIAGLNTALRDFNQRVATAGTLRIGATQHTTRLRDVASLGDWSAQRLASALGSYRGGAAGTESGTTARILDLLLRIVTETDDAVRRMKTDGIPLKYE